MRTLFFEDRYTGRVIYYCWQCGYVYEINVFEEEGISCTNCCSIYTPSWDDILCRITHPTYLDMGYFYAPYVPVEKV